MKLPILGTSFSRSISSFLLAGFLFTNTFGAFDVPYASARQGCCSHHGGVCGCGCCDGSSLSNKCAPYYPSCNKQSYTLPVSTKKSAMVTSSPIIIKDPNKTCDLKFSGTIYEISSDRCVCPNGLAFDEVGKRCPEKETMEIKSNIPNTLQGEEKKSSGWVITTIVLFFVAVLRKIF